MLCRHLRMSKVPCWQTCLLWNRGHSPRRRLGRQQRPPWRAWTLMKVALSWLCYSAFAVRVPVGVTDTGSRVAHCASLCVRHICVHRHKGRHLCSLCARCHACQSCHHRWPNPNRECSNLASDQTTWASHVSLQRIVDAEKGLLEYCRAVICTFHILRRQCRPEEDE